jgi:hypothetical protein
MVARARTDYVQLSVLALVSMSAGRRTEAVRWLQLAGEQRDSLLLPMLIHSIFPPMVALRQEPAYQAVVRELGWESPAAFPEAPNLRGPT